jgi:hypothetical protein
LARIGFVLAPGPVPILAATATTSLGLPLYYSGLNSLALEVERDRGH